MKTVQSLALSAAVAIGLSAPASAATTDPETILYRVPGVVDNGGSSNTGVATVFSCTNFSGVTENVRFATRSEVSTLISNVVITINHLATRTVATHPVVAYTNTDLGAHFVFGGTTAIAATSINIICTALITDAATSLRTASRCAPSGSVLFRGVRSRRTTRRRHRASGPVQQGTTAIAATSINIICTAMSLDAFSLSGVAWDQVRSYSGKSGIGGSAGEAGRLARPLIYLGE